jgi:DNA-directed RNA polymerase subunit RPC12/RpoP
MEFQDKVLTCIDCGAEFVFTAGEQLFFHDKRFTNEPKRCKTCKSKRVAVLTAAPAPREARHFTRVETRATCSQCGKERPSHFLPRMLHAEADLRLRLTAIGGANGLLKLQSCFAAGLGCSASAMSATAKPPYALR